jgi:UDP-N-acetylglucosamine 2-epimerase
VSRDEVGPVEAAERVVDADPIPEDAIRRAQQALAAELDKNQ